MIVVDSSAWIEFLRDTDSPVCNAVDRLLDADLAVCDAISMEILAGARDDHHLSQLRGLINRATMLPTTPQLISTRQLPCIECAADEARRSAN